MLHLGRRTTLPKRFVQKRVAIDQPGKLAGRVLQLATPGAKPADRHRRGNLLFDFANPAALPRLELR